MLRRTTILRKSRLSPVSAKRKQEMVEYAKKRKAFLAAHPTCQVCGHRKATDVHHRKGRLNGNYLDESTWLATCRPDHDFIHRNPSLARSMGLLG